MPTESLKSDSAVVHADSGNRAEALERADCDIPIPDDTLTLLRNFVERAFQEGDARTLDSILDTELSLSHIKLLLKIDWAEYPMSLHELANVTGLSVAAAGRNVDRLVTLGLVYRREDTHDRRVKRVTLTPLGKKELATLMDHKDNAIRDMLERVPAELRIRLHRALEAILCDDFWPSARTPTSVYPSSTAPPPHSLNETPAHAENESHQ